MLAIAALTVTPSTAGAWAPASQAQITPGVQTDTAGGQCTANFVFTSGSDVFIGQAAHCAGTGAATETDGCDAQSLPLGTPVGVSGATRPGTLAYSSWLTMQEVGETDPDACAYNDFALVRIDPADVGRVNPSVPRFGGPVGLGGPSATGDVVYSYGNSSLRLGVRQLSPKQGIVVETTGNGWSRTVYTATPGIPGDSGSGFLDADGAAIGTLSTLAVLPTPLSNGVADLGRELDYARAHGGLADLQLVNGTEPFRPDLLTAILGG
ncbi:MAG TPA: trypsin-like peptidase domain-containing protein [Thermoleophilaceae bacterium]|nr:trypsin-like peptidase domain-containing protein [Thermoleophilaceae bacterium]